MNEFALIGPDYVSESVAADSQMTQNWYLEMVESGMGKGKAALYPTPGLELLGTLTGGQGRGIHTAQGRTFAVVGSQVWEIGATAAAFGPTSSLPRFWGTIITDGNPVSICSGPNNILIASAGHLYLINTVLSGTLLELGSHQGLLGPVSQVAYADGFYFALIANSNQIQSSNPLDPGTWSGVAFTQVSVFPDNVLAIFANKRYLGVFGPTQTQVYEDFGTFPFPYGPVDGGLIDQGLAAQFSVAAIDNSVFWLGADTRGQGVVWRLNGFTPQRISTHALEYELTTFPTISDAYAFAYQEAGHSFYVLHFPSAFGGLGATRVYDCATQTWHRRAYYNLQSGLYSQHRAGFHTFNKNVHIVLDPENGNVYQQALPFVDTDGTYRFNDDAGNPIRAVRTCPHISNDDERTTYSQLQVLVESGMGPNSQGRQAPTIYRLLDAAGQLRDFGIRDNGIFSADLSVSGLPATTFFMNDQTNTSSWQITLDAHGIVQPMLQATFNPDYPPAVKFVSLDADQNWTAQLTNLGSGIGVLKALAQGAIQQGPEITLELSKDYGHSFLDFGSRECGLQGQHRARVVWNRLGQARDLVPRISTTARLRLIKGYIE